MTKWPHRILILLLTLAVLLGAVRYYFFSPRLLSTNGVVFDVPHGMSKSTFVAQLKEQRIFDHDLAYFVFVHLQKNQQLKAGEYYFPRTSTLLSIWRQVTTGSGLYYRPFSIIPGWTYKQIMAALSTSPGIRVVMNSENEATLAKQLNAPASSLEGLLLPETYNYTKGDTDDSVLSRAYRAMQTKLMQAWATRATGLPFNTPYEALIAASLVEREAYLNSERPLIAGVLINRLRKNMLLQFDPTVIYGMGDKYQGHIAKSDLREDTPYNTYVHKGLPPTPIAMPSMSSIDAVLHPAVHDYYYFVAKGDGSHQFSKSLPEHNKAVMQSIQKQQTVFFNNTKIVAQLTIMLQRGVTL